MTERRISRVVIACDAVSANEASIEIAAQLATWLDAALRGIFIEDEALLNLTAIPAVRHIGAGGESFAAVDEPTLLHQFAAHAARMRAAIEAAARTQELAWSFDVVRGIPSTSILDMRDQDLLVIEAESRPFVSGARLASRLLAAALESERPILLLRNGGRAVSGIIALVQGSAARAASLITSAARLASASDRALTLFLTNAGCDERAVIDCVCSISQELAARSNIERPNRNTLANVAAAGRLLVIDADPTINDAASLRALLATTRADILFLR